jgi:hypothetical protein
MKGLPFQPEREEKIAMQAFQGLTVNLKDQMKRIIPLARRYCTFSSLDSLPQNTISNKEEDKRVIKGRMVGISLPDSSGDC